jgi:putative SOS response-associated peptidase YedK
MLTINADRHESMCHYHRPGEEKCMVVILAEDQYDAWFDAPPERSMGFMRPCPPQDISRAAGAAEGTGTGRITPRAQ